MLNVISQKKEYINKLKLSYLKSTSPQRSKTGFLKGIILFFLFLIIAPADFITAQTTSQKKYKFSEVYDLSYGINIYEKLVLALEGDSVRNDKRGYAAEGWIEDYYDTGKLLHKGYYSQGKLKLFKNYFENGQVERNFKIIDFNKSSVDIFYIHGQIKSQIEYYRATTVKEQDFFSDGKIEYIEEMSKDNESLSQRKSYFENGSPQSIFELTDKKKKIYSQKEFYETGNLKEEGAMQYNKASLDYVKEGVWKTYDDKGKLLNEEIYIAGELNKKIK